MMDVTVLETDRLILRELRLADAPTIAELAGDVDVAKNTLTMPHPYPPQIAVEWIQSIIDRPPDDPHYTTAIVRRDARHLIGVIGFTLNRQHNKTEIGYWTGKPYWGNGYTPEAAQAIVDFCFETLQLNRVEANYYASNTASKRVMEKVGMRYEGMQRQAIIRELPAIGYRQVHDLGLYAILREDWLKNRG